MRQHQSSPSAQRDAGDHIADTSGPGQDALDAAAELALERELSEDEFLGMTLPPAGTHLKLVHSNSDLVKSGTIEIQSVSAGQVKLKIHIVTVWPLPNMDETDLVELAPNGQVTLQQDDGKKQKLRQTESPSPERNRIAFKNEKNKTMAFEWNVAQQQLTIVSPKATLVFGKG